MPPTLAPLPSGSLRAYVFVDFTMTVMSNVTLAAAIDKYMKSVFDDAASLFAQRPQVINTNGNVLDALGIMQALVSSVDTFPDVIFLACTADVSIAMNDVLKKTPLTAGIPVISIHTANPRLCDPTINPSTICLVPRDFLNVRASIQIAASQLNWASAAVILSNDEYGRGVASVIATEVLNSPATPTIVTQMYMPQIPSNSSDEAVIRQLTLYNPVGIFAFVQSSEMIRLRNAANRLGVKNIFFLGTRESLNIVATMTGGKGDNAPDVPLWGALVVSQYVSSEKLAAMSGAFVRSQDIDEMGAFLLCHLFDAMRLIMNARASTVAAIRSATVPIAQGFTGAITLDQASFQRSTCIFRLISDKNDITRSLVTWSLASFSAVPKVDVSTTGINSIIAPSPLLAVTVCMTAPSTCVDIANVNTLLFYLLDQNANRPTNTSVSYIPIPVFTGSSGVEGLSNLIPVARSCTFLTGPGRSNVAQALTPVINQFGIPQLDYSTASGVFSNMMQYPYFSRVIPQETFQFTALGETASYFGWERVILISTNDAYGTQSLAAAQSSMDDKTILVEATYQLSDTRNATIAGVFQQILATAISRVIVFLVPLQGDDAANFFVLTSLLGMNNPATQYIFFLSNDLCQYALSNTTARFSLMSSICLTPYVDPTTFKALQDKYNSSNMVNSLQQSLFNGGFTGVYDCDLSQLSTYTAFALDAGAVIANTVKRAQDAGRLLTDKASLLPLIRSTTITTSTGTFSIDANGDRNYAAYSMNVQTPNGIVTFAKWDNKAFPNFVVDAKATIVWFDNSTTIPSPTYRSIAFITQTTISTNPGTIVLSVLGFAGTIAVFFFCYRHYKMQRLIEMSLEQGTFPVGMKPIPGREMA